jgi:hypothetical protein
VSGFGLPVLFVAVCVSGARGPWSGEVKNSLTELSEQQQAFCRAKISSRSRRRSDGAVTASRERASRRGRLSDRANGVVSSGSFRQRTLSTFPCSLQRRPAP